MNGARFYNMSVTEDNRIIREREYHGLYAVVSDHNFVKLVLTGRSLTRMSCENHGRVVSPEKTVLAQKTSGDDLRSRGINPTEYIIKNGRTSSGVDGTSQRLYNSK